MSERGEKGSATIVESAGAGPTDLVSEVENLVRKMIEHELAIAKLRADLDEVMRHTNFLGVPRMPGGRQ